MSGRWRFALDAGGTFTDCIGVSPRGEVEVTKVLSGLGAVADAVAQILGRHGENIENVESLSLRMGTTRGTNALLERRGAPVLAVVNEGFGDLMQIGDQTRPDLFALDIERPEPLFREVLEVESRADAGGRVLRRADVDATRSAMKAARLRGMRSCAIALIHAPIAPELELELATLAREVGFEEVVCSHEVAHARGLLARSETTVVDAYLTPTLREMLDRIATTFAAKTRIEVMQSNGGLVDADRFRGRDSVMSGPAGGVVAVAHVAQALGLEQVIGFDMGGTSTDVCRWAGALERRFESEVAGVRIRTPMLELHTVAAGGGSLCEVKAGRLTVGPESAGSDPGPLCYGHANANAVAITDLNLHLGRLAGARFPMPIDAARIGPALDRLDARLDAPLGRDALASGLVEIADEAMASAIRRITVGRGHDPRRHALIVFGGAGGQHACSVAARLGIREVVFPPLGGVLSAYGIGVAPRTWHAERDVGASESMLPDPTLADSALDALDALAERDGVREAHGSASRRRVELGLGYAQSRTTLQVPHDRDPTTLREAFEAVHEQRFGYRRERHPIELRAVHLFLESSAPTLGLSPDPEPSRVAPERVRIHDGHRWIDAELHGRESLGRDASIEGPCVVVSDTGTLWIPDGWRLRARPVEDLGLALVAEHLVATEDLRPQSDHTRPEPVALELFHRRFAGMAEEMGAVLERTALSTNIRDRRDFSCAIFDAEGGLVANAPHIPVHLGAMSETVRAVAAAHPEAKPGEVYASNDPAAGGSHLPDITVVTPVFDASGERRFYVASRGHHADVGGITPGSMPPHSKSLADEGVVFRAMTIVRDGALQRDRILARLAAGPHPARRPDELLADLEAQIAANRRGEAALAELVERQGMERVQAYMRHIQDNAAASVREALAARPDARARFEDALDDGSPIVVTLDKRGDTMSIDFEGSAGQHPSNLNAPRAVGVAAVLYVLRSLVGDAIPLNSGCLEPITLRFPERSILNPGPEAAVVAGNVETSQRVVDVLLGALGLAAASQGTMNNLSFGTRAWGYYETLGGGAGATSRSAGADAVHTHMTNTRLTDPELLEARYPVRLVRFARRRGSGGRGRLRGGDGMIRSYEFLEPLTVSILSERRARAPFGLHGGESGQPGRNLLDGVALPGRSTFDVEAGQILTIETPGGGAWGTPESGPSRAEPEDRV